jgi:hypothetical protein
MRIVSQKEFLPLPSGTIFQEYEPCCLGPVSIKGDAISDADFFYINVSYAVQDFDSPLRMENGSEEALDFDTPTRDGSYDTSQLYAIWSDDDREALIKRLGQCEDNNH